MYSFRPSGKQHVCDSSAGIAANESLVDDYNRGIAKVSTRHMVLLRNARLSFAGRTNESSLRKLRCDDFPTLGKQAVITEGCKQTVGVRAPGMGHGGNDRGCGAWLLLQPLCNKATKGDPYVVTGFEI
ncbi:hypothetical protein AC628_23610 [Bradyrhizobium sp. NAS96.2]|nr:hypothetical protein AC628_23610 [Bradyrhizobium sp. NAS96.2]